MRRILALSLALASAPTLGQVAQEERGPYVGFGIGQLDYSDAWFRIDYGDTTSAKKIIAGFQFKDSLAFESYYSASGDFTSNVSGRVPFFSYAPFQGVRDDYTARFTGDFSVLGVRVLGHAGRLLLGLGFFSSDLSGSVEGTSEIGPFAASIADSDTGFSAIIGAQWKLKDWAIRAEYEYLDLSGPADAVTIGAGAHYVFR